jgi:hypothetical protein
MRHQIRQALDHAPKKDGLLAQPVAFRREA